MNFVILPLSLSMRKDLCIAGSADAVCEVTQFLRADKKALKVTKTANGYSVMMWSAHSMSETKTGGLPNFAP
jgi:hypothetical protein